MADFGEPEVMAARALLYSFLAHKAERMGGEVDIEKRLPGMPDRDLIDVWLHFPGKPPVAYRIFQRGPQPSRLRAVAELLEKAGAVTWHMLTASRLGANIPDELALAENEVFVPAYDRHLFCSREWDRYYHHRLQYVKKPGSLLYIDPQAERMVFYRGLWHPPDCNPNVFQYKERLDNPIGEIKMLADCEFVFPQELPVKARWEAWAEQEKERAAKEAERRARLLEEHRQAQNSPGRLQVREQVALQEQIRANVERQVAELVAVPPRVYRPGSAAAGGNPFACEERVWHEVVRAELALLFGRPGASARIVDIAEVVATRCGLLPQYFNFRDVAVVDAIRRFFEEEARTKPVQVRGGHVFTCPL
ncbi:MAG TPA: hypothetical protein VD973_15330 [Symbiobacteriaceae bacterium]|nr:hypothetical protein [Symbiobacteriaceae bacterium]